MGLEQNLPIHRTSVRSVATVPTGVATSDKLDEAQAGGENTTREEQEDQTRILINAQGDVVVRRTPVGEGEDPTIEIPRDHLLETTLIVEIMNTVLHPHGGARHLILPRLDLIPLRISTLNRAARTRLPHRDMSRVGGILLMPGIMMIIVVHTILEVLRLLRHHQHILLQHIWIRGGLTMPMIGDQITNELIIPVQGILEMIILRQLPIPDIPLISILDIERRVLISPNMV
jgi:hypothetical protein